jgi:hypothetical protein
MNKVVTEKCEVEEQIYQKRRTVRYDIRDFTVEMINSKYDASLDNDDDITPQNYNTIYVPEYQRDFTWDEKRQSKLIESIILGLPIPFIFVAENKNSSWEIVDGSQRIRTIHNFIGNNLTLTGLESLDKLNGYIYERLDGSRQGKFLNTALRIIVLSEETTDDIKKDMFERINNGSDLLKPMEKRKGIYPGHFSDFIYRYCSNNDRFRQLAPIDKWLIKRQEHEELLLRFFALSENDAYASGCENGVSKFLDQYLDTKNKELEKMSSIDRKSIIENYTNKINDVCIFVEHNFPFGFRHVMNPQTKRSVFEAISLGVDRFLQSGEKSTKVMKARIEEKLKSSELRKFTHVANESHKKVRLSGRVNFIYDMLKSGI